jgi:hypothetical protein
MTNHSPKVVAPFFYLFGGWISKIRPKPEAMRGEVLPWLTELILIAAIVA